MITTYDVNNLFGYVTSKFLQTSVFKWIDHRDVDSNEYSSSS